MPLWLLWDFICIVHRYQREQFEKTGDCDARLFIGVGYRATSWYPGVVNCCTARSTVSMTPTQQKSSQACYIGSDKKTYHCKANNNINKYIKQLRHTSSFCSPNMFEFREFSIKKIELI